MKPGIMRGLIAHSALLCAALLLVPEHGAWAKAPEALPEAAQTQEHSTLDGKTTASGIREWIEIAEPGNLGLLLMGIAGLLIGRWAARASRHDPPPE